MSFDLPTLQSGADRKIVCDEAIVVVNDPVHIAEQELQMQTAYEKHFSCMIVEWTNETGNILATATRPDLTLEINDMVHGNILSVWEGDLTDAGYTVTRGNAMFKIELPL